MEGIKDLVEGLKEFVWDIIGYFMPGIYLVILLSVFVLPAFFVTTPLVSAKDGGINFVTVVLAYLLGYVIYGMGEIKENMLGKRSYRTRTEVKLSAEKQFTLASELLQKKLDADAVQTKISDLDFGGIRSIAMGYAPEADKKVYTFMFRSDLSRHIANISLLTALVCLLLCALQALHPAIQFIRMGGIYLTLYIMLAVAYIALNASRDRFYRMAMRVPFQIFISIHSK